MDDQGKPEWFLSMQTNEDSEKITLHQETYIENAEEKFSMQDSNPSKTPAENNLKLVKATDFEQLVDEKLYRSLVGSLFYIAKQTRPDMVWIVNVLSRFIDKPANSHWLARKRVLRYLQGTNHSNSCTQETVTTIWLVKVMQTGVEIMVTEDQPLVISSNWDSVGEQSACKPRSSRQWLSLPAKLNIRV